MAKGTAEEVKPYIVYPPGAPEGSDPRLAAYMPVSMIHVDQNVQRPTTDSRLDGMLAERGGKVDWAVFETITVTHRDDGTWVATEGQHRVLLTQRELPEAWVWAIVNPDGSEAGTALGIARGRRSHSPLAQWNLRLKEGGLLEGLAVARLAAQGISLTATHRWDGIVAVGAVERVMKTYGTSDEDLYRGADLLDSVISLLTGVWGTHTDAMERRLDGQLIRVAARLISRNEQIRLVRLAQVLSAWPPSEWLKKGKEKHPKQTSAEAIGVAIINVYNRNINESNEIRW
jgi:hypothetical protein